jgi:hypothetical protein
MFEVDRGGRFHFSRNLAICGVAADRQSLQCGAVRLSPE